jgi:hypothetical protein
MIGWKKIEMDLNYLFHRQQVERSKAASAESDAVRQVHEELAARYEEEIKRQSEGKVAFPRRRATSEAPDRSL